MFLPIELESRPESTLIRPKFIEVHTVLSQHTSETPDSGNLKSRRITIRKAYVFDVLFHRATPGGRYLTIQRLRCPRPVSFWTTLPRTLNQTRLRERLTNCRLWP